MHWLEELGMSEAVWVLQVKEFGSLVVAMDFSGKSLVTDPYIQPCLEVGASNDLGDVLITRRKNNPH